MHQRQRRKSRSRDAKPNRMNRNNKSVLAATSQLPLPPLLLLLDAWQNDLIKIMYFYGVFFSPPFSLISLIMIFSLIFANKFRLKAATTKSVTVWQLHQINRFDHHSHSQCNGAFCSQNICLFFQFFFLYFNAIPCAILCYLMHQYGTSDCHCVVDFVRCSPERKANKTAQKLPTFQVKINTEYAHRENLLHFSSTCANVYLFLNYIE